mmetsp:Transcript_50002/g.132146  ORF Transcript_50002/g.132146 Transcript_50002/m.132146 type:complete len:229 (+) Transcript_50002:1367-2053(+)
MSCRRSLGVSTASGTPSGSAEGKSPSGRMGKDDMKPSSHDGAPLPLMMSSRFRPSQASLRIGVPVKPARTMPCAPWSSSRSRASCTPYCVWARTRLCTSSMMTILFEYTFLPLWSNMTLRSALTGSPSSRSSVCLPPAEVYRKARSGAPGIASVGNRCAKASRRERRIFPMKNQPFISRTSRSEAQSWRSSASGSSETSQSCPRRARQSRLPATRAASCGRRHAKKSR